MDNTLQDLVSLLVKVTRERDEALDRCARLNQQLFELMMDKRTAGALSDSQRSVDVCKQTSENSAP